MGRSPGWSRGALPLLLQLLLAWTSLATDQPCVPFPEGASDEVVLPGGLSTCLPKGHGGAPFWTSKRLKLHGDPAHPRRAVLDLEFSFMAVVVPPGARWGRGGEGA